MGNDEIANNIFVGRQPIFDRKQEVVAYELLYRAGNDNNFAEFPDGDRATTEVIINSVLDIGLDSIVGSHPAYFNLTGSFIRGDHPLPLDNRQVVLEILEDIEPDENVVEGMRKLAENQFIIALDDFVYSDKFIPLLEIAHIVKLEVMGKSEAELSEKISQLKPFEVKLLAEKVETHEEFEMCKALGFEYFQGYFLCKPHIIEGRSMPANRLVVLSLLAKLQDPNADIEELEQLIVQDVSLTYRLLRFINSAAFALGKEVESVHRALILIGTNTIKKWVNLLLLARIDDKPRELMRTALIRGRMCELLADLHGHSRDRDHYFTCGLFSVLDALMDRPMNELLAELPLNSEVKEALLENKGEAGKVLTEVLDYEKGAWQELLESGISVRDFRDCYLQAVLWADESMGSLQSMKK
ncbi:EAL and HDOD domain-containing protein [Sedimenticola sp.]|uniref:EAL and HDOD domain-containing protein n=1 Tax=Sedimenticola sp. TaxID=1940285 RepID=UPI003D12E261